MRQNRTGGKLLLVSLLVLLGSCLVRAPLSSGVAGLILMTVTYLAGFGTLLGMATLISSMGSRRDHES